MARLTASGRTLICMAVVLSSLAPSILEAAAPAAQQKNVLVFYATRRDAQVAVLGDREFPRLLQAGLGETVDYYGEYLDIARFSETTYQAAVRDFLLHKYRDQKFDLVIAMHDIAFTFIERYRDQLFPDAPVVFLSSDRGVRRPPNSVGVIAPVDLGSTLTLASSLQPEASQVIVVSGADPRDREYERQARQQFELFDDRFTFTYLSGLPTLELEARLAALPHTAIVYYLLVNRDGTGETFHPLDYLERVTRVASVPVYCWVDSAVDRGIVGGSLRTQSKQVVALGELAIRILRGEPADSIPFVLPDLNQPQVDWRQLRRWNISETRVPQGTVVLFRDPSVWDRFKFYIIGAVAILLIQTTLIAGLLVQRLRRHRAEQQMRASEKELRRSYDHGRYLAARLLTAQDDERARIARELHDDVSQQLALLSGDLELLSGLSEGESSEVADGALRRVETITRSVREVSHQLHPAKLRLIGLVPSLAALQRDVSKYGVHAAFTHDNVPADLPPDLTLCLYRVVQEALSNAAKHSGASHVRFHLQGGAGTLQLQIADDGVGFVPDDGLGRGLGLVSMRERLEAVGGQFQLESTPGKGTTIRVVVPVQAAAPEAAAAV